MAKTSSRPKPHARARGLGASPVRAGCRISGRVWVEKGRQTFLSWGRVVLLERIGERGSISAAARSMGMGYRHAWDLVDEMNRLSPKTLVRKVKGGPGGGGAELTPEGEAAVAGFWELVDDFGKWLSARDARLWRGKAVGKKRVRK